MSRLISTETWDAEFFEKFRAFPDELYRDEDYRLGEDLNDLEKIFSTQSPFSKHNLWKAFLAIDGDRPCGRIVVSMNRDSTKLDFVPCGYFECVQDLNTARLLFDAAEKWVRERGWKKPLRGPIQGNFFNSYRIKLAGGGEPFYGEPVYPDYYHRLFSDCGFSVCGHWQTVRIKGRAATANHFSKIVKHVRPLPSSSELKIRTVDLSRWNEELQLIHRLLTESFSKMPEFMPISFEEFEAIYDSFRYLIKRRLVFFVEYRGEVRGFFVSYFDPLKPLIWRRRKGLLKGRLRDLAALIRVKLGFRKLLVVYVGKIERPGEIIKGVSALFTRQLLQNTLRYGAREALICYLADGSPTFASLPKDLEVVSEYVLYQRAHHAVPG